MASPLSDPLPDDDVALAMGFGGFGQQHPHPSAAKRRKHNPRADAAVSIGRPLANESGSADAPHANRGAGPGRARGKGHHAGSGSNRTPVNHARAQARRTYQGVGNEPDGGEGEGGASGLPLRGLPGLPGPPDGEGEGDPTYDDSGDEQSPGDGEGRGATSHEQPTAEAGSQMAGSMDTMSTKPQPAAGDAATAPAPSSLPPRPDLPASPSHPHPRTHPHSGSHYKTPGNEGRRNTLNGVWQGDPGGYYDASFVEDPWQELRKETGTKGAVVSVAHGS